jgi:hypothetical protein
MNIPNDMVERFEHLVSIISSERFLKMQGLGNEVPFFICPFPPSEAVAMEKMHGSLVNQLGQKGLSILEINLYDLAVELLKQRGIWDRLPEMEQKTPKDQFKELLQGVLDSETHLIPAISQKMDQAEFDVLFMTGVG